MLPQSNKSKVFVRKYGHLRDLQFANFELSTEIDNEIFVWICRSETRTEFAGFTRSL